MPRGIKDFKAYIFDWDGTLNSPTIINHPFWLKFKKFRFISEFPPDEKELAASEERVLFLKARKDFTDIEESLFVKLADVAFSMLKPRFHNGSRELLDYLNSTGKSVALFTDGGLKRVYVEIKHLKAFNYFDVIVSAQSIKRIKPDPTGLKIIERVLNLESSSCIYFGDRPEDIAAAHGAGMKAAAMLNGFSNPEALKAEKPEYVFNSMEEVLAACRGKK
ncbi:HAD family hydrolase [Candidatus Marsarchaeota archaeon]|nr:HAD family hydrolase [Candidatus Marsarchaeota archaeon]MCL5404219.1 HAD family hydrolase [Candidatus Marsarchaeota archaeon]